MTSKADGTIRVGIIGAGVISEIYLQNLSTEFAGVEVIGVADIIVERAVIVELKACRALEPGHEKQVLNYLRASAGLVAIGAEGNEEHIHPPRQ